MDRNEFFRASRTRYPSFVYEGYSLTELPEGVKVSYSFSARGRGAEDISFRPALTFRRGASPFRLTAIDDRVENLAFHIGLIEMISYWKCVCSPRVVLKAGSLSAPQRAWLKKLFYRGLGEFLYVNEIQTDADSLVEIVNGDEKLKPLPKASFETDDIDLVPIGGGKDSIVTLGILAEERPGAVDCLMLNPIPAALETVRRAGLADRTLIVDRVLDPKLLELNDQGYLNGHTPFSALLAFVGLLGAALTGRRRVVLSNEAAADEGNAAFGDTIVNHQYSKSFEFERDFRDYVAAYLTDDLDYFSFLRPVGELTIAALFAERREYFDVFNSCNRGGRKNVWCGHCPKCLFTRIVLSPFVPPEDLNRIFGGEMVRDAEMNAIFDGLTGRTPVKPFDCVGTRAEVLTALTLAREKWGTPPPFPVDEALLSVDPASLAFREKDHCLPPFYLETLKRHVPIIR